MNNCRICRENDADDVENSDDPWKATYVLDAQLLETARCIASGMACLHEATKSVHLDLKPANIMFKDWPPRAASKELLNQGRCDDRVKI
eukprot:SAG11_NODE_14244_length_620_cov_0.792706_3_plen_88_part_01